MVAVYSVADEGQDTLAKTKAHLVEHNISVPVLYDAEEILRKRFGVRGYPAAFLVDNDGKLVWKGDPRRRWK